MASTCFRLTAEVLTPIAYSGSGFMTLDDGILWGILDDLRRLDIWHGDPGQAVPLAHEVDGLYLASAIRFQGSVVSPLTKIGASRPVSDMDAGDERYMGKTSIFPKIRTGTGSAKAVMSTYHETAAAAVSWDAVGHPAAACALLKRSGSIGALRKDGHGRLGELTITEIDAVDVLLDDAGRVRRPVPRDHPFRATWVDRTASPPIVSPGSRAPGIQLRHGVDAAECSRSSTTDP